MNYKYISIFTIASSILSVGALSYAQDTPQSSDSDMSQSRNPASAGGEQDTSQGAKQEQESSTTTTSKTTKTTKHKKHKRQPGSATEPKSSEQMQQPSQPSESPSTSGTSSDQKQ